VPKCGGELRANRWMLNTWPRQFDERAAADLFSHWFPGLDPAYPPREVTHKCNRPIAKSSPAFKVKTWSHCTVWQAYLVPQISVPQISCAKSVFDENRGVVSAWYPHRIREKWYRSELTDYALKFGTRVENRKNSKWSDPETLKLLRPTYNENVMV
jgi:hypothetical protein